MKRSIEYSDRAADDLERIRWRHIQRVSPQVAEEVVDGILRVIRRTIAVFPNCGRPRPELGRGVRSFPDVPYVIFYRATTKRVLVLRVLHGKRDIKEPLMSLLLAG